LRGGGVWGCVLCYSIRECGADEGVRTLKQSLKINCSILFCKCDCFNHKKRCTKGEHVGSSIRPI
jgi:hypothetical protein